MHYKQVQIPCQSVWIALSLGLSLGHTQTGREFVLALSSLVYFWGDKKMIKAMWPDSRNDLLTVSGVSYYTHARKNTPSYNRVKPRTLARQYECLWLDTYGNTFKIFFCLYISSALVPVLRVSPQIPHHVWGIETNLSGGCCRDLSVSSIPSLSVIFLHVFLHLQLLTNYVPSSTAQCHTDTYSSFLAAVDTQKKILYAAVATAVARGDDATD